VNRDGTMRPAGISFPFCISNLVVRQIRPRPTQRGAHLDCSIFYLAIIAFRPTETASRAGAR
jgi:hypothetical protein